MKRIEISRCFVEPVFKEGSGNEVCGFNIIAQSKPNANGNSCYWVHTNKPTKKGGRLPTCYTDVFLAEKIAHSYLTQGFINPMFWHCFEDAKVFPVR